MTLSRFRILMLLPCVSAWGALVLPGSVSARDKLDTEEPKQAEPVETVETPETEPPLIDVPSDQSDAVVTDPSLPPAAQPVDQQGAPLTPQTGASSPLPVRDPNQEFTSTSFSKQFLVHGKDPILCSALSKKVDEIRKNLLTMLKVPQEWKYPIGIRLMGAPGSPSPSNPVRMQIKLVEGEPSFTVFMHIGRGIDLEELNKAVTIMLLYELTLRKLDTEALPDQISLPPWLLFGVEQAILWKTDSVDRPAYATLFEREEILQPDSILSQKDPQNELDATSFAAYKASCGALVLCLLSQKGGEEAMLRVFNEAILGSEEPVNLIKRNFPLLTLTPTSLHKWWTLQLSTMATPSAIESLSIQNSEKQLKESLILMQFDPATRISTPVSLDQIETVLAMNGMKAQLKEVSDKLVRLSTNCFPTYQPIVVEYANIVTDLQFKKPKPEELKKRIAELVRVRNLSVKAGERARDYLDWYEISTKTKRSNTFDSYMETVKMLRDSDREAVSTPISGYLRDVERLYTLPANAPTPVMKDNP